jgi:signal peptide peptidase SppA
LDSPGGEVFGVSELADKIYAAREQKKIIAVANSLMASAAYWIGSSAHEIVATPSSITGSIGVIAMHEDWSKALESMGVKTTIITAGEHKADGSPYAPLTEPAAIEIKKRVDYYYEMFTESVGRNRGNTANQVKKTYGDGRVFNAKEAKDIGLIDRIDTLQGTINRELAKMAKTQKNKNLRASII